MTQYAHARALHILEDVGLDADDARYVMKRLYDLGLGYVGNRDTGTVAHAPPADDGTVTPMHPAKAARKAVRGKLVDQMRAEITLAREKVQRAEDAATAAHAEAEAAEKARHNRELKVQLVLAGMDAADRAAFTG